MTANQSRQTIETPCYHAAMKTHLRQNVTKALLPMLPGVILLLLVGCGKAPALVARESGKSQSAEKQQAESEPAAIANKAPAKTKASPATSPVDVSKFMEDSLNGDTKAVEQDIESGVNVNAIDEEKRTALMLAAFNGHTATVKLLLDHGAKLSERDSTGRTALMFAATGDNAAACETLLAAGADVNATDTGEGFTALMHAAAEGQLEVVKLLLQHNAERDRRDIDGDTAKSFAEKNGHTEVVKALAR